MTKKSTKSSTDKGRKRVAVKDLPKPTRELSSKEIKQVRGGTVVPIPKIQLLQECKDLTMALLKREHASKA